MTDFTAFLQANIIPIYFIYGLVHFVAGFAVALETGRASQLRLSRALPFLAAFGLTHGINEWIEMFSMITAQIPTMAREPEWAETIKLGWKALSFFLLFEFGARLLIQLAPQHKRWLRWLPLASLLVYIVGALALFLGWQSGEVFELQVALGEVWTNYAIGLPASIFAGAAMLAQRRVFAREEMPQFGRDLVGAALALGWYALLDQVIDEPTPYFPSSVLNRESFLAFFGVPIEVMRIVVVGCLAFFVIRVMRVFEVEYARRLDAANRARFAAQEEAKRELTVMFEACRTLGTSLDVHQLLDDFLTHVVTLLDPMLGAAIYLYDPTARTLAMRAKRVRGDSTLTLPQQECSTYAARQAFETSEIAYESESQSGVSFVAVPLVSRGQTIGALCLVHRSAFSNYAVIHTLARQLGIALENARLYAEVQDREQLRGQLLERTVAAQEEERKRIARELHDETGQMLTALAVGLGGVEQTIEQDPSLARHQIAQLKNMTMNTIDGLRQFVSDLRPSLLDDLGLVAALRWLVERFIERTQMQVDFEAIGTKRRLSSQVETVLFRIAQEGLNNVGRHARATRASVRLEFADRSIVLTVEDNGKGFVVGQVLGTHTEQRAWGLLGVQERVELVGGKFSIDSEPGRGTRLRVEIPIVESVTASLEVAEHSPS